MNYWIFVATKHSDSETGENFTAREILERRLDDGFWGLRERTPHRKNLKQGDRVVFYEGRPASAFAAEAELDSASLEPDEEERSRLSHDTDFFRPEYGVYLRSPEIWETKHPVDELAPELDFIDDPSQWWLYLQGGIRQISEADYHRILSGPSREPADEDELEQQSLFALESHLEEFIDKNWPRIDWGGENLRLHQEGDQTGRQYPAGTWSIDFLAIDNETEDWVVIELKRGQSSDSTIGQVLRYMGWVRDNMAEDDQSVRGIIVANEVDEALRYAARTQSDVDLKTYSVSFQLQPVDEG